MSKRKIEIIDNQVLHFYVMHSYIYRERNWFINIFMPSAYELEWSQWVGYKYKNPDIHNGRLTTKEYFEKEVGQMLKDYNYEEIHRTVITNK